MLIDRIGGKEMELAQALVWIRTEVYQELLQEYEDQILYWRGREIAKLEKLSDYHSLQSFFLQKGLGILEFNWSDDQHLTVCITDSPLAMEYKKAKKAIALEAGLVTEMLQQLHQAKAVGSAIWVSPDDRPPYIEVAIVLEYPK